MGNLVEKVFQKARVSSLLQRAVDQRIGSGMAAGWGSLKGGSVSQIADAREHLKIQNLNQERNSSFEDLSAFAGITSWIEESSTVNAETFFDLASLTKVMATTSLYMVLVEKGLIDLQAPISSLDPEWAQLYPHLAPITVFQLLTHTSGLVAHRNFFEKLQAHYGAQMPTASREERKAKLMKVVLSTLPECAPEQRVIYSDLGFMILSELVERKFPNHTFEEYVQRLVWSKIPGGTGLHFRPVVRSALSERAHLLHTNEKIAATELCPWRGLLMGQVHDDNCWSMGGISGHSGVFGTLNDVRAWILALFSGQIVSHSTVQRFTREQAQMRRTLGFDMPSLDGSGTTGYSMSSHTVGHLGFTGTSAWVDLQSGDYAILLTNRVHPSREDLRIRALRKKFHEELKK